MNYYRNTTEIVSLEGVTIESGFLWERQGELMVLVDEDQHITSSYDIKKFNLEKNR